MSRPSCCATSGTSSRTSIATWARGSRLGTRIDALDRNLSARIDGTNERLDGLDRRLSARIDDTSLRLEALTAATQSGFQLLARADGRRDRDMQELRERLDRVEQHVGLPRRG